MLLGLSVLWGGSFFFVEVILAAFPPLTLVFCRVALAATFLWIFMILSKRPIGCSLSVWTAFAVMGLLNNMLPFSLIAYAQTEVSSGLASILNATTPLFAVIVAGLVLPDERLTKARILGVVIGIVGIVVLIGTDPLSRLGGDLIAQLAVLIAALSYAFAGVFGRRFRALKIDPIMVATGQLTASACLLAPLAFLIDRPDRLLMPDITIWAALAGLAIMSTSLAYVIYFRLLAGAGATNLLLVTFLIPVSAIALGVSFLGEVLQPRELAGMVIIALGLITIDGRLWRKASSQADPPVFRGKDI